MINQLVAGTVILNGQDGNKRFLVSQEEKDFNFIISPIKKDLTSLASILGELKKAEVVDVTRIGLVELTTIKIDQKKMPLYVFEIEEENLLIKEKSNYVWETPQTIRNVLGRFDLSGVPIFE